MTTRASFAALCIPVMLAIMHQIGFAGESGLQLPSMVAPSQITAPQGTVSGLGSTIDDYLKYAAENNPGLRAASARFLAATERPAQAKSLSDPLLTYKYAFQSDQERQSIGVEQMLPWPGKLDLKKRIAEGMASAEYQRYLAVRRETALRVKEAYYEYYYLGRSIEIARDNLELMKRFTDVALARYKTSLAMYQDVVRAQVELGKMENELRSMEDMTRPAVAKLNAAIGRPAGEERPVPGDLGFVPASIADDGALLAALEKANPMLAAMRAEAGASGREGELMKKESRPDFMVGLEWVDMKPRDMDDEFMGMIGIALPVRRSRYRAAAAEAEHTRAAILQGWQEQRNALSAELRMESFKYRDAERRESLYRDTLVPKAKEAIATIEIAYRAGTTTFLDLIEAERTLLEFQLQYQRAATDRAIAAAQIEMLAGQAEEDSARAGDYPKDSMPGEVKP